MTALRPIPLLVLALLVAGNVAATPTPTESAANIVLTGDFGDGPELVTIGSDRRALADISLPSPARALSRCPEGEVLAVLLEPQNASPLLHRYQLPDLTPLDDDGQPVELPQGVHDLQCASPNGTIVILASLDDGGAHLHRVREGNVADTERLEGITDVVSWTNGWMTVHGADGERQITVMDQNGQPQRTFSSFLTRVSSIAISPDGMVVVVVGPTEAGTALEVISRVDGTRHRLDVPGGTRPAFVGLEEFALVKESGSTTVYGPELKPRREWPDIAGHRLVAVRDGVIAYGGIVPTIHREETRRTLVQDSRFEPATDLEVVNSSLVVGRDAATAPSHGQSDASSPRWWPLLLLLLLVALALVAFREWWTYWRC